MKRALKWSVIGLCLLSTASAQPARAASEWKRCDANIRAKRATTTCAFAARVVQAYRDSGRSRSITAYSPVTKRSYNLTCSGSSTIRCRGGTAVVQFSRSAAPSYDDEAPPAPVAPGDDADPPMDQRIPNYDEGRGYPVQCADGMWSQSGGIQGACSGHGGVG